MMSIAAVTCGRHCSSTIRSSLVSWPRLPQLLKLHLLIPLRIKLPPINPLLKPSLDIRPLTIQHRKPRRIPIPALSDHMLPEHALKRESQSLSRPLRRCIEIIAFPLISSIPEFLECGTSHEIHGFCRCGGALEERREHDG